MEGTLETTDVKNNDDADVIAALTPTNPTERLEYWKQILLKREFSIEVVALEKKKM